LSVTGEKEEGFEEGGLGSTAAKYQGQKLTDVARLYSINIYVILL